MTAPLPGPAAAVYPQVDPGTGAPLMVKVFHRPFDPQTRAELEQEQATLAGLRHVRSILPTTSEVLPDGRTAIRMPRCPQSLAQRVHVGGPIPVDEAVAIAEVTALALAAAHRAGLVHGGVHPHNVLLTAPTQAAPEAVLSDFGLAARRTYGTPSGEHLGFAAPETVREGTRDQRSDVYGIGVVLYFALTGKAPYPAVAGEPEAQRILRMLSADPPSLERDDVPEPVQELVTELLTTDPQQRPDSASAVANRLTVLLAGGRPGSPVYRADHPRRPAGAPVVVFKPERPRRRRISTGQIAAFVGVVLAVGAVATALLISDDDPPAAQTPPSPSSEPTTPSTSANPTVVRLDKPKVSGTVVELSWHGPPGLDYVVWFREEGRTTWEHRVAGQRQNMRLPIERGRDYCFRVDGSNVDGKHSSRQLTLGGSPCE